MNFYRNGSARKSSNKFEPDQAALELKFREGEFK
jgi:hypothetical protein